MARTEKVEIEYDMGIMGLVVEGFYEPGEDDRWSDANGDPGTPGVGATFEITNVYFYGIDITQALKKDRFDFDMLEQEIINKYYI